MRAAVVGHVEWVEFARVDSLPAPGQIVHATESWAVPAGGGAVTAVQLARLAGGAHFFTALGDDELGHRAHEELVALGLQVHPVWRPEPQRRAFVHLDSTGERTITVIGRRMGPSGDDDLPWDLLDHADAVYVTAGDPAALRRARQAKRLVGTARVLDTLRDAQIRLDALVASSKDEGERYSPGDLDPAPDLVILTAGGDGGRWGRPATGESGAWQAAEPPGPVVDSYGCGDSFAGGVTYGLGAGMEPQQALELGARCGAFCAAGPGPYESQLREL